MKQIETVIADLIDLERQIKGLQEEIRTLQDAENAIALSLTEDWETDLPWEETCAVQIKGELYAVYIHHSDTWPTGGHNARARLKIKKMPKLTDLIAQRGL